MNQFKKITAAVVLCLCTIMLNPYQAFCGEWWVFADAGTGSDSAVVCDLTLRRTFDPFYENNTLSVSPLAELSLGYWHEDSDDSVFNATLAGGLLVTFQNFETFRPYISGAFGGTLISDKSISDHEMGQNFQFRSKGSLGVQFGGDFRHSVQLDIAHFSNASMNNDNDGFNTLTISYGYRF